MPRTYPPRRVQVRTRIGQAGVDALDRLAKDTSTDRSKAHRAVLAEALARPAIVDAAKRRLATEVEL